MVNEKLWITSFVKKDLYLIFQNISLIALIPIELKEDIQNLILKGKTEEALNKFLEFARTSQIESLERDLMIITSNHQRHLKNFNNGVITLDEYSSKIARINQSVLDLIENFDSEVSTENISTKKIYFPNKQLVELLIDDNLHDFNTFKKDDLITVICALLKIDKSQLTIKSIIEGSVKFIIETQFEKANILIKEFEENSNALVHSLKSEFKVISIKAIENLPEEKPKYNFKKRAWEFIGALSVIVGIIAGLGEILNFWNIITPPSNPPESGIVTVLVHGVDGKDQLILPNRGIVKLIYGDAIVSEQINNEGEATFKQIPEKFFQNEAKVEVLFQDPLGESYRTLNPDSLYQLTRGKYIALPVELILSDHLSGIVKNSSNGDIIVNAIIRVQGEEAISNEFGEFALKIPIEKLQKIVTIRIFKDGYTNFEKEINLSLKDQGITLLLKPDSSVTNPPPTQPLSKTVKGKMLTSSPLIVQLENVKIIIPTISLEVYPDQNGQFSFDIPTDISSFSVSYQSVDGTKVERNFSVNQENINLDYNILTTSAVFNKENEPIKDLKVIVKESKQEFTTNENGLISFEMSNLGIELVTLVYEHKDDQGNVSSGTKVVRIGQKLIPITL